MSRTVRMRLTPEEAFNAVIGKGRIVGGDGRELLFFSELQPAEFDFRLAPAESPFRPEVPDMVGLFLKSLPDRERKIVELRYGVGRESAHGSMPLHKVGVYLGITAERIRQIEMRAMKKIREFAEEAGIDDPR